MYLLAVPKDGLLRIPKLLNLCRSRHIEDMVHVIETHPILRAVPQGPHVQLR
jgi:hypothetical protein